MNPEKLAECIGTAHQEGSLVGAQYVDASREDGDTIRIEYDGPVRVYRKETEALLERGYAVSGIIPHSDGEMNVFLRPVTETERTVEVTKAVVSFDE